MSFNISVPAWTTVGPPLFRPGNPALCGSRPLVTPYYCRLGDLMCFVFMSAYCMFDLSVYYLFIQYFDTVGWVFWPVKNRLPYNLYCVGGDVKHCSINQSSDNNTDMVLTRKTSSTTWHSVAKWQRKAARRSQWNATGLRWLHWALHTSTVMCGLKI